MRSNPKPEHILQVMIYLEAMKHLPYGIVYYINRDKMDVIEHHVELSHGVAIINGTESEFNIESVYDRYILMTGYLDDEVLPPCDYCPQYPIDDIDDIYRTGGMYKSAYNAWLSDGTRPCDGRCRYLCSYHDTCVGTTSVDDAVVDDSGHGAIVVL